MTTAEDRAVNPVRTLAGVFLAKSRIYVLLTLLCAAVFAPGLVTLPPTDRDESRFMQATKQMIESRDFLHIRFQDEPRDKKPIGLYWLQAAAAMTAGKNNLSDPWPYRLPSALAAWIAVLATYRIGQRLFDTETGFMAGAMVATTLVVAAEAHLAKTDASLLAATTLCLGSLARLYLQKEPPPWTTPLWFWLALTAGVLIKGPVIVMIVGATIVTLTLADRRWRWLIALKPVVALVTVVLVAAYWMIFRGGGAFVAHAFREDVLPKLIGGQEGHGLPPGTHVLLMLVTAWPWSLLVPFALITAWQHRNSPNMRFCLAWLVPAWLVFEVIPTKLPHYTLPLMPPAMLLCAAFLRGVPRNVAFISGRAGVAFRSIWSAITLGLGVAALIATDRFAGSWAAGGLVMAIAVFAAILPFVRFRDTTWMIGLSVAGALFAILLIGEVAPHLRQLALSSQIAQRARPLMTNGVSIALSEYHEPSAIFLLGTRAVLTDPPDAIARLIADPKTIAIIPRQQLDKAREALGGANDALVLIDTFDGYDYARGHWLNLALVGAKPAEKTQ